MHIPNYSVSSSLGLKSTKFLIACWIAASSTALPQAAPGDRPVPTELKLWPGLAPGETAGHIEALGPERDTTRADGQRIAGRPVIRLGGVTEPTLTFYPAPGDGVKPLVLVCPGGGYHILAWDLEGTEVCEWLNEIGYHAALLKYRVPRRENQPAHLAPLQDAQRAMSLIRARATDWQVDSDHIGVLGFSAGGHLAAVLSTGQPERAYKQVDASDEHGFRPQFTLLIYPANLIQRNADPAGQISPLLTVNPSTPPTFLAMTQDDAVGVEHVLHYAVALQQNRVPLEMHVYPEGGHGYGLRRTELPVTHWHDRATDWLRWLRTRN